MAGTEKPGGHAGNNHAGGQSGRAGRAGGPASVLGVEDPFLLGGDGDEIRAIGVDRQRSTPKIIRRIRIKGRTGPRA